MSAFKLHTLKQKLWAIVSASFVARVVMFYVLPNTPSTLAPDEGTYSSLVKWISESNPANEFPVYPGLYLTGRSVLLPSSFLVRIGFHEIDAVRIISSTYALFSLSLVVIMTLKLFGNSNLNSSARKFNENLAIGLILIYAFLPSHFIWSNLGLREAGNEFWLIITFLMTFYIFNEQSKATWPYLAILPLAIFFVFSSRPQVGWLTGITLLIYSLMKFKIQLTYIFATFVFAGIMAGHLATSPPDYITVGVYKAVPILTTSASSTTETTISAEKIARVSNLCDDSTPIIQSERISYKCVKVGQKLESKKLRNPATVAKDQIEIVPTKQSLNQLGAASQIKTIKCPLKEDTTANTYACLLWRAPYTSGTFLFRPLPIVDTRSNLSFLASVENLIWILGIGLIFLRSRFIPKGKVSSRLMPSTGFLLLYTIGAGSYAGNMGTAFRHKSLILWIVLLLLFAVYWRNDAQEQESRGNNSQESAV